MKSILTALALLLVLTYSSHGLPTCATAGSVMLHSKSWNSKNNEIRKDVFKRKVQSSFPYSSLTQVEVPHWLVVTADF